MAFNKNSSKRLSIIAGINRESSDVIEIINTIAETYIHNIIKKTKHILIFTTKKTLSTTDIGILAELDNTFPQIICNDSLNELMETRMTNNDLHDVLNGEKSYNIYTVKKSFNNLVRKIIAIEFNEKIKIGKNVIVLLQNMTEQFIIILMNNALDIMNYNKHDTLVAKDIALAHKGHS